MYTMAHMTLRVALTSMLCAHSWVAVAIAVALQFVSLSLVLLQGNGLRSLFAYLREGGGPLGWYFQEDPAPVVGQLTRTQPHPLGN